MSKIMCDFREQKVEKTLIFYTHTHTHTHVIIGEPKKSPVAILTESADRAIRKVHFTLHSDLRAGLRRGSFFPARFVFSGFCHTCLCAGLPLNRMVFFNNVNK